MYDMSSLSITMSMNICMKRVTIGSIFIINWNASIKIVKVGRDIFTIPLYVIIKKVKVGRDIFTIPLYVIIKIVKVGKTRLAFPGTLLWDTVANYAIYNEDHPC